MLCSLTGVYIVHYAPPLSIFVNIFFRYEHRLKFCFNPERWLFKAGYRVKRQQRIPISYIFLFRGNTRISFRCFILSLSFIITYARIMYFCILISDDCMKISNKLIL